ncbi:Trehalose-6-P synthase/phosphatase complex subunit [Asimina triloba]
MHLWKVLQYCKRHEELKQAVQQMLEGVIEEPLEQRLTLINDIQRLGVAYQFEPQIHDALINSLLHSKKEQELWNEDLRTTSLYFRLLRQHGCYVSPDIFMEFKDEAGGFKASLCEDVDGLLSLYEASYLGMKGETILDEARIFASSNLKKLISRVEADIGGRISGALDLPLHWKPARIEARHYTDVYEEEKRGGSDDLLEFAKLDFNMVQAIHQTELKDLATWWESVDLSRRMAFFRDRLMESFLGSVDVTPEPSFSACRMGATKIILLVTILDDIYDIYGSLDELELLTNAIERWDLAAIDQLPEYMKLSYLALFNTMNEYAYISIKDKGCNVLNYIQKLVLLQLLYLENYYCI